MQAVLSGYDISYLGKAPYENINLNFSKFYSAQGNCEMTMLLREVISGSPLPIGKHTL